MKQKQHSTAEIIRILRQGESGRTVEDLCREHNTSSVRSNSRTPQPCQGSPSGTENIWRNS